MVNSCKTHDVRRERLDGSVCVWGCWDEVFVGGS